MTHKKRNKKSFHDNICLLEKLIKKLLNHQNSTHGLCRSLRKTLKEITLYKNHENGCEKLEKQKAILNIDKIQIGGGKHKIAGYLNIDIMPPADIIYDIREKLPIKNNSCECIFTEHFLEHLDYPISVKKFIKECYRVLKPKKQIIIGVPDSELVIKNYYKKNRRFYNKLLKTCYSKRNCLKHFNTYIDLVNYIFRDQDDNKKYNPHFWAYDYEKLFSLLKKAGFSNIKRWSFNKKIANPKRKFCSIYLIATK